MYYRPKTLTELKENLSQIHTLNCFLSGCTDMVLKMKKDGTPEKMIDLSYLDALKGISYDDNLFIGAGTTLTEIIESDLIKKHAPILCLAADQVGSTQIRNTATIGGNIANAFAGADMIPPLYALEANIHIYGKEGERVMKIQDFIIDNRVNALQIGEIVSGISFKPLDYNYYFGKIGSRTRVTISKLNMAALVDVKDDVIKDIKLSFGALGKTAFRAENIESQLMGQPIHAIHDELFMNLVDEKIPTRASRHYKREAIKALVYELVEELRG